MTLEEEVFKKYKIEPFKLEEYGFKKNGDQYVYEENFLNNEFKAVVTISNGKVYGKIIELEFGDEYTNFKVNGITGEFVNTVKLEYIKILNNIASFCFEKQYFLFEQSNRITRKIIEKYNVLPEFLWEKYPNIGVFRNARSDKWFGIIMDVDGKKIAPQKEGVVEVLNVKLDSDVPKYIQKTGIYECYHMSKKNWVSIILDNTLKDEEIMELIGLSFNNSDSLGKWIVPANPKYYDVIGAFENSTTILWKQSSNIIVGDEVYIYVAEPYSAIMYKCVATKTNIPYSYKDDNVTMSYAMEIKLVKKYNPGEFTFKKLNEFGIKAVRGPRSLPEKLLAKLNE